MSNENAAFDRLFKQSLPANAATARHQLWQILKAPERFGWKKSQSTGRFDVRKIHQLGTGNMNIFKRRENTPGINTAVSILIDGSGSMSGMNERYAAQVAYMIADACEKARALCEVVAFKDGGDVDYGHGVRGDSAGCSNPNNHWETYTCKLMLIKDHRERNAMVIPAWVAAATDVAGGGTPDYAGIRAATERLAIIPGDRRLLFVITDGTGAGPDMIREAVKHAETLDITVVGVGIGAGHDVTKQYKFAANCENPADLSAKALPLVLKALRSARVI